MYLYPIANSTLSFGDIADHWSRDIYTPASWDKILRELESAWWRGELRGISSLTRLQRLKNMFTSMRHRDDLGIVFIVGKDAGPPLELPDESPDLRHQIRVPSNNTESWDEAACADAFHTLAGTSSRKSYPELTVALTLIKLSYEEFSTWCTKRGFRIPTFWKPRDQLVAPQERKAWRVKPGYRLSAAESQVLKAINELWPYGILDHKAKGRDERIWDRLGLTQQSTVSPRTIQRTLKKIHFD